MRRSFDEYRDYLVRLWLRVQESLMFVTARERGRFRRVGAIVLAPLTAAPYHRGRLGVGAPPDLLADAFACPSTRVFVEATAGSAPGSFSRRFTRSWRRRRC